MMRRNADLACWLTLGLSAAIGAAAFGVLLAAEQAFVGPRAWLHGTAFVLVLLLPFVLGQRELPGLRAVDASVAPLLWPLAAAPLLALPGGPLVWLVGVLLVVQGALLARARQDGAAGWALPLGPALVLACMARVESSTWAALLPLSLFAAAMALLAVQERRAGRRRLERALRVPYGALETERPAEARPSVLSLPTRGLVMGAMTLALLASLHVLMTRAPRPWGERWVDAPEAAAESAGTGSSAGARAQRAFSGMFPSDVRYAGGVTRLREERVMHIVPRSVDGWRADPRALTPLYLRGLALELFDAEGARYGRTAPLVTLRDPDDGVRDGWTELAPAQEPLVELLVRQQAIRTEREDCVLFCPEPVLAVGRERLRTDGEGLLLATDADTDWIEYGLLYADRRAERLVRELGGASARHPDARFTALPPASSELEALVQQARGLSGRYASDLERVLAVIEHFKTYDYSIQPPGFPGLGAVTRFLQRRKGHCTHFASAAALLLRAQGIPTRVAAGFVATRYSPEDEALLVTTRDAHAWIEVFFEGRGWIAFDPTPPDRRLAALRRADGRGGGGAFAVWMGDVVEDFSGWAARGGDLLYLESLLGVLGEAPRVLAGAVRQSAFLVGAGALALVALIAWCVARVLTRRPAATERSGLLADSHYAQLLAALARHGFHKRPAQTPREFAALVALSGGAPFGPVQPITERLYRVRFGGQALADEEERTIDAFIVGLRARA
jgi:hypothetical protein